MTPRSGRQASTSRLEKSPSAHTNSSLIQCWSLTMPVRHWTIAASRDQVDPRHPAARKPINRHFYPFSRNLDRASSHCTKQRAGQRASRLLSVQEPGRQKQRAGQRAGPLGFVPAMRPRIIGNDGRLPQHTSAARRSVVR